ncbi:MAG: hypothetical protein INQ03_25890 [Candidatus Heimdallarchaeota archaeon]|nr:hypothetical protein [Candidatus Heimdallarchaeota archaeon]
MAKKKKAAAAKKAKPAAAKKETPMLVVQSKIREYLKSTGDFNIGSENVYAVA